MSEEANQPNRVDGVSGRQCAECGYALAGLTESKCPECGEVFEQPQIEPDASFMAVFGRLGLAGWLGLAWAVVPGIAGVTLVVKYMKPVSEWLHDFSGPEGQEMWKTLAVYVVGFVVLSGIGVMPTVAISMLGGYAFGPGVGFGAALAGFGGASIVGYFVARTVGREKVEQEIQRFEKARAVRAALVGGGFWKTLGIVTLVRVPPNSPFALTNGTLATTGVRMPEYIIGTLVGMAPRTFAYAIIGHQITDWSDPEKPKWLFFVGIAVTIVVIAIIGSIANKALKRVTNAHAGDQPGEPAEGD